jgi:Lon protease-like protein
MIEVALFPIPQSVAFPGVPFPLHVFEPRYRQMVRHCIEHNLLMGVCQTEKVLHTPDKEQSMEEALQSNQATYKPRDIFSAGPVALLEELEDGRMLIEVDTSIRLRLQRQLQTLPFNIWACTELPDQAVTEQIKQELEQYQQKILQRLSVMTHGNSEFQKVLASDHWKTMDAITFSFAVLVLFDLDAELKQELLEMTAATARLDWILALLNQRL